MFAAEPNGSRPGRSVALALLAGLAVLVAGGCADRDDIEKGSGLPESGVPVLGQVPWFALTNQAGASFGTDELRGNAWVATFIFTRCTSTCPLQINALVQLAKGWEAQGLDADLRVVAFSVDPEFDSPAVLQEYATRMGADTGIWTFLTGSRRDIWGIASHDFYLPVFNAPDDPEMLIAHSQKFVLVDRTGRIRGYYDGLDEDARGNLLRDLARVLQEAEGDPEAEGAPEVIASPASVLDPEWVPERSDAQIATAKDIGALHDFHFRDDFLASGIRFQHRIVDDAGRTYKPVHYDHGNGVVVGDVDGDGWYDLYFSTQLGSNQLWRNLGDGTFEDITGAADVGLPDQVGVSAAFADIDNDGDPDLFTTSVRGGNTLFENLGDGTFRNITKEAGVAHVGHSSAPVFFDYDRDGRLDLFVSEVGVYTEDRQGKGGFYIGYRDAFAGQLKPERLRPSHLFHNLGGNRFEDVTEAVGLADSSWTGDASPIDINQDGWLDLYMLDMQGHDEYYENDGGKRFVKKSRELFPATPWGSMGIKVFDWNNDGRMDIYVTDMHTDMVDQVTGADTYGEKRTWQREKRKMLNSYPPTILNTDGNHIKGNAFFENRGGGKFVEISSDNGTETFWPWGLSTGDLNADGFEDIFVAGSMNYPYRYAVNSVLLNDRGKTFRDAEYILGVEPRRGGRTAKPWFELDCSGEDKENPHCEGRTGRLTVWGSLGTRSSVIFDLDGDGDLDIVTNEFGAEPMVLISDLRQRHPDQHYLQVKLVGSKSNRDGLGTRVAVKAGSRTLTRVHDGKSGYMSQSSEPLYFGLASAAQVDRIDVTWPSGATQTVQGPVNADQVLEVREPDGS